MARGRTVGERYRGLPVAGRASVATLALIVVVGAALIAQVTEGPVRVRVAATAGGPAGAGGPVIAGSALRPGARQLPSVAAVEIASPPPADTPMAAPATVPVTSTTTGAPATTTVQATTVQATTLPAAGYRACVASMTNAAPPPGSFETVLVRSAPADTAGTVLVHYRTQTNAYPVGTDSTGSASYVFGIGTARSGYPVDVDVTVGARSVCSTSFTPQ